MEKEKIVVYADPDLADEIPWYMGQVRDYIAAIGAALDKEDFETIQDSGHRMKGSGVTFGFEAVSEIGKSIEMAAREKDVNTIQTQIQKLAGYIDRVEVVYEAAES